MIIRYYNNDILIKLCTFTIVVCILLLLPCMSVASELNHQDISSSFEVPNVVKTIVSLLIVVSLILVISWSTKKIRNKFISSSINMKILAVLPIGSKERILLIDVKGEELLISSGHNGTRMIHRFSENNINSKIESTDECITFHDKITKFMCKG